MIIHPQIEVTPDTPTIKFREAKEQVDLDKELPRILNHQGWDIGTYFHVQFINFERTHLLSSALFVVIESTEKLVVNDSDPYHTMSKMVSSHKADRVSKWWYSDSGKEERDAEPPPPPEPKLRYDQSAKEHVVMLGHEELFRNPFKGKCQEFQRQYRAS